MNKFKLLVSSLIAMLAFAIFAVTGIKVQAMSVSNNNKTATWTTSDMDGMLQLGNNPTSFDSTKSYVAATSFKLKSYITLIPVPSATSAGSLTITPNGTNADRYCYLIDNTTNVADTDLSFVMNGTPSKNFTSANVLSYNSAYYIGLICLNGTTRHDFKANQFVVTLTSDDSYATQVQVSYYLQGGSTAISSSNITSGDTLTPSVTCWGKTITGYYSDSACTAAWDTTAQITSNTSVYCKYTDWTMDANVLDLDMMNKGYETFGPSAFTSDTALTGTIYTLLQGNTAFAETSKTVGDLGKSKAAIVTGGGFSDSNIKNGLRIQPTADGTLSMYVYSSSNRTLTMYDSSSTEINSGQSTGASTMTLVTYNLEANKTYNFGGSGSLYIYYASFEEKQLPTATFGTAVGTDNDSNTAIAFIVKLENVEDVTLLDAMVFTVKATFNQKVGNANYEVSTCYEALTAFGDVNNYAAVDGTYYVYFTVYGITSGYSGMKLDVTFNATYDGSAITANTTYTYTYTA